MYQMPLSISTQRRPKSKSAQPTKSTYTNPRCQEPKHLPRTRVQTLVYFSTLTNNFCLVHRQALKHHPDRVPADSPERTTRTKKFQQINDAYYTLSDPGRRRDYDATRQYHFGGAFGGGRGPSAAESADEEVPRPEADAGGGFNFGSFPWSAFGFGGQAKNEEDANKFSNEQFGGVFEEMLRFVMAGR